MHAPGNWKEIALQTAAMLKHIGRFNPVTLPQYRTIKCPVLLVIGDRDKLVTFVETTTVYKELSNGQMAVLPGTPHHLKEMNITLLAKIIKIFISGKAL